MKGDALTRQISGILQKIPRVKSKRELCKLQEELTNTENKISYSRLLYNSVTSNYNVVVKHFQVILLPECLL